MALFPSFLQPLFAFFLLLLVTGLEFFKEHKEIRRIFFSLWHAGLALLAVASLLRTFVWKDELDLYYALEAFLQGWAFGSLLAVLFCFAGQLPPAGKKRTVLLKLPWLFALIFLTLLNLTHRVNVGYLQWALYLIPWPVLYAHPKLKRVFNHYGLFIFSVSLANLITFNTLLDATWIQLIHSFFWVLGLAALAFGLNTLEEIYD